MQKPCPQKYSSQATPRGSLINPLIAHTFGYLQKITDINKLENTNMHTLFSESKWQCKKRNQYMVCSSFHPYSLFARFRHLRRASNWHHASGGVTQQFDLFKPTELANGAYQLLQQHCRGVSTKKVDWRGPKPKRN